MIIRIAACVGIASVALAAACGKKDDSGSPSGDSAGSGGGGATAGSGGGGGGGSGGAGFDCAAPSGSVAGLRLTQVTSGLDRPVYVGSPPGDTARLFVAEQAGRVHVIENGTRESTPFLDIVSKVTRSANEQGFLGLAFHPDYAQNGRFFVHYSTNATGTLDTGDTVISEFRRSAADANTADPASERVLLTQSQPYGNHNGGSIEFGPDGFLYIGLGDGGLANDPQGNGQSTSTLLGKILRIDVDATTSGPYGIPAGNLTGAGARPEIWAYGLRNPWRFSFDACTGDLWMGDVGQNAWEEINFEPAGQGLRNYGWRLKEGEVCFNPTSNCDPGDATVAPVAVYDNDAEGCSVTGGYVYRGSRIPSLRGTYIYADFCSGNFWTIRMQSGQADVQRITSDINPSGLTQISSFGRDARGELYVTVFEGGAVYRIDSE
jgi:glucose/arabinose dehydrogenase